MLRSKQTESDSINFENDKQQQDPFKFNQPLICIVYCDDQADTQILEKKKSTDHKQILQNLNNNNKKMPIDILVQEKHTQTLIIGPTALLFCINLFILIVTSIFATLVQSLIMKTIKNHYKPNNL